MYKTYHTAGFKSKDLVKVRLKTIALFNTYRNQRRLGSFYFRSHHKYVHWNINIHIERDRKNRKGRTAQAERDRQNGAGRTGRAA